MGYPSYSEYQQSNNKWVEKIPSHWEDRRLKFSVSYNDESLPETTDPDFEIAYVDISGVDLVNGIKAIEKVTFEEAPSRARRIVQDGDTIISTVRTYLKAIAPIVDPPENMIVSTGFAVIRPLESINQRFLGYVLQNASFVGEVVANSTGVSYPAINPSTLVCIPFSYPKNKSEQQKIADFLDWKTAQIDSLIAKKKQLIEKLREKRMALITQAVTKGLDPDAPMRDSGIPWLGEVPGHWNYRRLRFLIQSIEQGWSPRASNHPAEEGSVGVLKLNAVQKGRFNPMQNKHLDDIPANQTTIIPEKSDVLITRANTPALVGDVCYISQDYPDLLISDLIYRIKTDPDVSDSSFLMLFLLSLKGRYQIEAEARGSSGSMLKLAKGHVKDFWIPEPPKRESEDIVAYCRKKMAIIERLVSKIENVINHLTEYRTALITAATTGKIDVRNIRIPKTDTEALS